MQVSNKTGTGKLKQTKVHRQINGIKFYQKAKPNSLQGASYIRKTIGKIKTKHVAPKAKPVKTKPKP